MGWGATTTLLRESRTASSSHTCRVGSHISPRLCLLGNRCWKSLVDVERYQQGAEEVRRLPVSPAWTRQFTALAVVSFDSST